MENDSTNDRRQVKTREESGIKTGSRFLPKFSKQHAVQHDFTVSNHAEEEGRVISF